MELPAIKPYDLLKLNGMANDMLFEAVSFPYQDYNHDLGDLGSDNIKIYARTKIGDPSSAIYINLNLHPVELLYRVVDFSSKVNNSGC